MLSEKYLWDGRTENRGTRRILARRIDKQSLLIYDTLIPWHMSNRVPPFAADAPLVAVGFVVGFFPAPE